ncbi:hypothetical protein KR018_003655 [Drosophila ironensis]|nr:hypothetical protein KR018_003655 [Drosophila ironensis]
MLLLLLVACLHMLLKGVALDFVEPVRYNLTILTHLEGGPAETRTEGLVIIDMKVKAQTKVITLHSYDLSIYVEKTWLVRQASNGRITVLSAARSPTDHSKLTIRFSHTLKLGELYTLYMYFRGGLNQMQQTGYFWDEYMESERMRYTITHMEPNHARSVFPCFDLPQFRSKFTLHLVHPKNFVALSNMPPVIKRPYTVIPDYVTTSFEETPPIPTHMFMWTIHRLKKVSNVKFPNGGMIAIWARPDMEKKLTYTAKTTSNLIRDCETLFGQPILSGKNGKMDVVVLPKYKYQKSSLGLLVFSESSLDPSYRSHENLHEDLGALIVREWYGHLVSVKDMNMTWVRDGINKYLSIQVVSMQHNDTRHNLTQLMKLRLTVMDRDSLPTVRELSADVSGTAHWDLRMGKMYLLTYMLQAMIGEKTFYTGLRNFFRIYANATASPNQLWEQIQKSGRRGYRLPPGVEISNMLWRWIKQPGYPLLTVRRDDEAHEVIVEQSRYIQPTGMRIDPQTCWEMPITYVTKSVSRPTPEWLGCAKETRKLQISYMVEQEEWFLLNADAAVPIRILYDDSNWQLLTEALHKNFSQLPELNRAALVDDSLHLAHAGYMHYNITLKLIRYLQNETSHLVWCTALHSLNKLHTIMFLTPDYRLYKLYMQQLLGPPFKKALQKMSASRQTTSTTSSENSMKTDLVDQNLSDALETETVHVNLNSRDSLEAMIYQLACQFDIPECISDALQRFNVSMKNLAIDTVPEGIRETVLCRGIRHNSDEYWLKLRSVYLSSQDESKKQVVLSALTCSTENWALQMLLTWSLDTKMVSRSLSVDLLTAFMKNYLGFHLARDFLKDNIENILRRAELVALLTPFVNSITTAEELSMLQDFFRTELSSGTIAGVFDLMELATDKVNWRKRQYSKLLQAMQVYITDTLK